MLLISYRSDEWSEPQHATPPPPPTTAPLHNSEVLCLSVFFSLLVLVPIWSDETLTPPMNLLLGSNYVLTEKSFSLNFKENSEDKVEKDAATSAHVLNAFWWHFFQRIGYTHNYEFFHSWSPSAPGLELLLTDLIRKAERSWLTSCVFSYFQRIYWTHLQLT